MQKNLLTILVVSIVLGCQGETDYKRVDFSSVLPVAHPQDTEAQKPLRVAVAAMISPKETFSYYQEMLAYIGKRLGRKVQLIQRKTYEEIDELFPKGEVDLAFICSGPYAARRNVYGFEALATPQVRGKPFYQSYLIVRKDSPYQSFQDLRGKVFAFTDPESNTGSIVPRHWLAEVGETPESFFKQTTFTYSHDNSILAVAKNLVDAAAVDGHQWEYYQRVNPVHTANTRVIRKSDPYGSPPVVASLKLDGQVKSSIRDLLLTMHQDPEGKQIIDKILIERFVPPQDEWYEPINTMTASMPDWKR
jgi:phosphonate transport system substrate-binding protein